VRSLESQPGLARMSHPRENSNRNACGWAISTSS